MIDELARAKVFSATVTGGEPLVPARHLLPPRRTAGRSRHPASPDLQRDAAQARHGGSPRRDRRAHRGRQPRRCCSQHVNDATRGAGAFERALAGIRTLLSRDIRPTVLVTVSHLNLDHLPAALEMLGELGVAGVSFNPVSNLGRQTCQRDVLELGARMTCGRLRRVCGRHARRGRSWSRRTSCTGSTSPPGCARRRYGRHRPHLLPCGAARTSCAITPSGGVVPCNKLAGYPCGDLRRDRLADIRHGEPMRACATWPSCPTSAAPGCAPCPLSSVCAGGCRAEAYLRFHDLMAPDPRCAVLRESAIPPFMPFREPEGSLAAAGPAP